MHRLSVQIANFLRIIRILQLQFANTLVVSAPVVAHNIEMKIYSSIYQLVISLYFDWHAIGIYPPVTAQ